MTNNKQKAPKIKKGKRKIERKKLRLKSKEKNWSKFVDYYIAAFRWEAVRGKFLILKYSNLKVF